jgi:hypothetical protein
MMSPAPCPAPPIAASLILPAIFLGSNYVPMRPYALFFSVFSFFYSFWIFSFCCSLLFLLSFSIILIILFLSFSSYPSLLNLLFLSLLILLIPAPPVAVSLILMALLMIYIEKTPRKFQFGKKSAKVFHSLYNSTEQLQVAL